MIHTMALGCVIVYDVSLELVEGNIDPNWEVTHPLDYWKFRDILSHQMLKYDLKKRIYKGDTNMKSSTKQKKKDRTSQEDKIYSPTRGRGRPRATSLKDMEFEREF